LWLILENQKAQSRYNIMKRCMVMVVAILAVFFGASIGTSFAQNEKDDKGTTTDPEELSAYEPAKSERMNAFMVEKIAGSKVRNMKGEDLGTIEDVVVDIDRGIILYVVMDVGGFLDIGGKLFPVPWRSFAAFPSEGVFFLDISKDKLKNAPGYDKNSLPDVGDMHWGTKLVDFYEVPRSYRDYVYDYGYDFRLGFFIRVSHNGTLLRKHSIQSQ
jgi:sporulation protein YlmC with PRC-barrel domain